MIDVPPHGQVLVLTCPTDAVALRADAVSQRLCTHCDGSMPYAGVLIDFAGRKYRFSSADLAAVMSYIAAWVRGWVAPCAVALTGASAEELRRLLDLTKLNEIEALKIVERVEDGLAHIGEHLTKRAS